LFQLIYKTQEFVHLSFEAMARSRLAAFVVSNIPTKVGGLVIWPIFKEP